MNVLENELERLIDAHGMFKILSAIYSICTGKAEHIRTNWGATAFGAREWEKGAQTLNKAISFPNWPL